VEEKRNRLHPKQPLRALARLGWGVDFVACYFQRVDAWLASWPPGRSAGASLAITGACRGADGQGLFGPAREVPAGGGAGRPGRRFPRPRGVSCAR
jgi:hypothetical protein